MKPLQFIPFYLLWMLSSAFSVLDWLALRSAINAVAAAITGAVPMEAQIKRQWYARWVFRAVDPCVVPILTILVLASIISFDYMYREAIEKGTVRKRFGVITGIQVGILIVSAVAMAISSIAL